MGERPESDIIGHKDVFSVDSTREPPPAVSLGPLSIAKMLPYRDCPFYPDSAKTCEWS
jgi:hypothetical protein